MEVISRDKESMYIYIFVWLFLIGGLASIIQPYIYEKDANGVTIKKWKLSWAIILFLPIFWTACMGTPVNDVPLYIMSYKLLPDTWKEIMVYLGKTDSGHGFVIMEWLIKVVFGGSVTAFRVFLALIHSIPVIYIFRRYCEQYWIGIYLFVASACPMAWMMNGMRQFVAVVIVFSALPLMIRKEHMKVILLVILAATFHVSAIIMLPIVFIVQGKAWNKKTLIFILVAIVAMFALNNNTALADSLLQGTEYAGSMSELAAMGDDGVNPIRVLVSAVPMLLSFIERRSICEENDQFIHICVNMSTITVGLNLVAMVTSGILVGRLAIYTSLYGFLVFPYLIRKGFTKESQKIVNVILIILYFVYYSIEMR